MSRRRPWPSTENPNSCSNASVGTTKRSIDAIHVFRHRRPGNLDAELEQLTMNPRRSPERVLKAHSSNQVANLLIDPRLATERTGLPSPVSYEPHLVPALD